MTVQIDQTRHIVPEPYFLVSLIWRQKSYSYISIRYQHYNIFLITFYIFNIPVDYEKDLAPKHTRNGERTNDPLPVYLSCEIITFDKISTLDMMFG